MQILYINHDGSGFADHIHVDDGTTVAKLFTQRVPHGRAGDYLIRTWSASGNSPLRASTSPTF